MSAFSREGQEAITELLKPRSALKEEADAKAHHWFSIATKAKVVDDLPIEHVMALVMVLERVVELR